MKIKAIITISYFTFSAPVWAMNCGKERRREEDSGTCSEFQPWLHIKFTWDVLKPCYVQVPQIKSESLGWEWEGVDTGVLFFLIFQVIQMGSHHEEQLSYCWCPSSPPDTNLEAHVTLFMLLPNSLSPPAMD